MGISHVEQSPPQRQKRRRGNVSEKRSWKMSLGKRLWKTHLQTYPETSQAASEKTVLAKRLQENVFETVHETRLRKPYLETLPKTTCPETSPETRPENVTGNRVWGTSLKLYLNPSLKIVSGNVPGK